MTITVETVYEKGNKYVFSVLYVPHHVPNGEAYINVQEKSNKGEVFKVEVVGRTVKPLSALKDKDVELVCTEVTDKGPEFALSEKYFISAPRPKPERGRHVGRQEGLTVEFKSSLLFKAETGQPDADQPFEIAKQVAALMNAKGGDLYLGVDDDGYVVGIEDDLPLLGKVPLMMNEKTDANWSYSANTDGFKRKLINAVRFYLGDAVAAFLDDAEELKDGLNGRTYIRLHVPPSDDVVYLGREEQIVCRIGPSVVFLWGRQRERYVMHRFCAKVVKSDVQESETPAAATSQNIADEITPVQADPAGRSLRDRRGRHGVPSLPNVRQVLPMTQKKIRSAYVSLDDVKIGKIAQCCFPVIFSEGKVSKDDVDFLASAESSKKFKTSKRVLKLVTTSVAVDALDPKGRKRYYPTIVLNCGEKKYLLTREWYARGRQALLDWLAGHGLDEQRILELMSANG